MKSALRDRYSLVHTATDYLFICCISIVYDYFIIITPHWSDCHRDHMTSAGLRIESMDFYKPWGSLSVHRRMCIMVCIQ